MPIHTTFHFDASFLFSLCYSNAFKTLIYMIHRRVYLTDVYKIERYLPMQNEKESTLAEP